VRATPHTLDVASHISAQPVHLPLTQRTCTAHCFAAGAKWCVQLEDAADGTLKLTGTTAAELTYGIGHYLREYCNMTVGYVYLHMPSCACGAGVGFGGGGGCVVVVVGGW
jgi:hypothetical protein